MNCSSRNKPNCSTTVHLNQSSHYPLFCFWSSHYLNPNSSQDLQEKDHDWYTWTTSTIQSLWYVVNRSYLLREWLLRHLLPQNEAPGMGQPMHKQLIPHINTISLKRTLHQSLDRKKKRKEFLKIFFTRKKWHQAKRHSQNLPSTTDIFVEETLTKPYSEATAPSGTTESRTARSNVPNKSSTNSFYENGCKI